MSAVILPAILTNNKDDFLFQLKRLEGLVAEGQLDFADGRFVSNVLLRPEDLADVSTEVLFEAHLMVQDPLAWVDKLSVFDWVETIIVHAEADDVDQAVAQVKKAGKKVGLAVRPETKVEEIRSLVPTVDLALIMTVQPGFMGSPFLPDMLEKVAMLRREYSDVVIEVDGGINPQTAPLAVEAGANRLVVGSFLEEQTDVRTGILALGRAIRS